MWKGSFGIGTYGFYYSHNIFPHYYLDFLLSLRGYLSKSLKQSGFVERLCLSKCLMSCEPLERIFYCHFFLQLLLCILFLLFHYSAAVSEDRMSDTTYRVFSLANWLSVCAVFDQAAVGPWISGNMVHSWWSPQVLLSCQHCKSARQFYVLKLQWSAVNDHWTERNINAADQIP